MGKMVISSALHHIIFLLKKKGSETPEEVEE
jgi:hypothetical protein